MENQDAMEFAVTQAQYRLSPDVPEEERMNFIQFIMMFGKITASSNIERQDVLNYLLMFDTIAMAYDDGFYEYAHELQAQFLTKLQLCRSIDGFETKWSSGGITKTEHIERMLEKTKKKTWGGGIKTKFFGKKKEPDEENQGDDF